MFPEIALFVKSINPKVRTALLIILIPLTLALSKPYIWPPAAIQPIEARVTKVESRVDSLTQNLHDFKLEAKQHFNSIERWMCFQNRIDAIKSGIDCFTLVGPPLK